MRLPRFPGVMRELWRQGAIATGWWCHGCWCCQRCLGFAAQLLLVKRCQRVFVVCMLLLLWLWCRRTKSDLVCTLLYRVYARVMCFSICTRPLHKGAWQTERTGVALSPKHCCWSSSFEKLVKTGPGMSWSKMICTVLWLPLFFSGILSLDEFVSHFVFTIASH